MSELAITQHILLDRCWVCEKTFSHECKREDHHVIPRAYGGLDGPQVSLCDSHHSLLHEVALRMYSKRNYWPMLPTDADAKKKVLYLAVVAYNARLATEGDPNKKQVMLLDRTQEMSSYLSALKKVYPRSSHQKLVLAGLKLLYDKHFK